MNFGIGKILIIFGIILIISGILFIAGEKIGLGKLFGDIYFKRGNFSFYFPITTSIIISIILTILLNIFFRK
ncbi:MAG: hypothetical protein JG767_1418 [Deferribacteraceae bacterium]|jgi:hypothetical protein|nr:hypothetical protein [Deferribacteraceae bacterium]